MTTQFAIEMKPVKSSNIKSVGYDTESKALQIQFKNGGTYQYKDVPADTFDALLHADSVGKYYIARIQNQFECEKVESGPVEIEKKKTIYEKLTADLLIANQAASEAIKNKSDGGTANLDAVFLTIKGARETLVLEAIKKAGLYCRGKRKWIGQGYMLTPTGIGQGDT